MISAPASLVPASARRSPLALPRTPRRPREIDLGHRHDAALTPSRSTMARCSRVCGMAPSSAATTSKDEIDAAGARDHGVHEFLVARHIDKAEHRAVRRRQIGEAEIDRYAARLLFLEAIGVDAGERAHQRGLAVIDVARGADDHGCRLRQRLGGPPLRFRDLVGRSAPRAGPRNGAASALPPALARSSQASAATSSRGTPAPRRSAAPSKACPSASPRAARAGHHAPPPPDRDRRQGRRGRSCPGASSRTRRPARRRPAPSAAPRPRRARRSFAFEQHPAQHVLRRARRLARPQPDRARRRGRDPVRRPRR